MLYLQPVIDALNKFNGRGKATYILCSDFQPCVHRYLINYWRLLMNWLLFVSRDGMQKLYQDAKWEKEKRSRVLVFTKKKTLWKRILNIFYKIVTLKLEKQYSDKLLEFQWVRILHHLLLIYFSMYWSRCTHQLKKSNIGSAKRFDAFLFPWYPYSW